MFSLVLLALADRADGKPAAQIASAIAARHGAGLAALHVSGPLSRDAACVLELPDESAQALARAGVEALLREVMPPGLTADTMHAAGFTHLEAQKAARILGPDLLVLGGLDKSDRCRRELSAGEASAALLVAEAAGCPVLVAGPETEIPAGPFLRVFVAADLAADQGACQALLSLAARLAAREGAELVAFAAVELPAGQPVPGHAEMTKRIDEAKARLAYLCHGLPGADRFAFEASEGTAAVEILKQAREHAADLLVLAVGGRGPANAGAVTERVLEGARCPVLLAGPNVLAGSAGAKG
jgi:nucleotide-binding universal stress UspA family protein